MRRRTAPRLSGFPYRGCYRYSLTMCTAHRLRAFVTAAIVDRLVVQLLQSATREEFEVLVYCFMPDHLHVLIEGRSDDSDMRAFVHRFKQTSAYYWKQQNGAGLWQRGYFEHTLRDDEDSMIVARYLIGNPLRAGLVENVLDYPFLGSQVLDLKDLLYSVQLFTGRP